MWMSNTGVHGAGFDADHRFSSAAILKRREIVSAAGLLAFMCALLPPMRGI
jgi:hypothetical protein